LPSQVEIEGLQRCGDQFAMVADQGLRCPPSGPVYAPTEEIRIETAMLSISSPGVYCGDHAAARRLARRHSGDQLADDRAIGRAYLDYIAAGLAAELPCHIQMLTVLAEGQATASCWLCTAGCCDDDLVSVGIDN
jgi:hypothetical protein